MKEEYIKISESDPTRKARAVLKRLNSKEYEIVKFVAPIELIDGGLGEQLLQEIADDADNEGITLRVAIQEETLSLYVSSQQDMEISRQETMKEILDCLIFIHYQN